MMMDRRRSSPLTPRVLLALAAAVLTVVASPLAPRASYEDTAVQHHNMHRAVHSAPNIAWDARLAHSAATLASRCAFHHDTSIDGGGYGQNIAAGSGTDSDFSKAVAAAITDMWYGSEVGKYANEYGKATPSTNAAGHFTQVVWKGSTRVGCATHQCPPRTIFPNLPAHFTVCNYGPPGNVIGHYAANVGRPVHRLEAGEAGDM